MIHIVMALIVFMIVVIIHLLMARQSGRSGSASFLFMASIGLMFVWFLFDTVTFIYSKYFLKSTATIMYLLLMPLYIAFYRWVNEMTPSRKVLQILGKKSKASYDELLAGVEEEKFIPRALETLVKNGQIRRKDIKFSLSGRGKFLAFFSGLDRKLFKRSMGGKC